MNRVAAAADIAMKADGRSGNPETGGQSCEMFRKKSKLREIKAVGRQHFMFLARSSGRQINKQSSSFQASANNVPDKHDILWRTAVEPLEFPPVGARDWACITWALFIRNIQMKPWRQRHLASQQKVRQVNRKRGTNNCRSRLFLYDKLFGGRVAMFSSSVLLLLWFWNGV